MLGTFILGLAAGLGAPYAEPWVKSGLSNVLKGGSEVSAVELRMVTFTVCLWAAAFLAMILAAPHAVVLVFGALVGVIAPRLKEAWKIYRAPDYDS